MFPKGPLFAVQKMRIMLNVFWTLLSASFVETQVGRKFTSLLGQVSLFLHRKVKENCNKRCACKSAFFGNNLDKLLRTRHYVLERGWAGRRRRHHSMSKEIVSYLDKTKFGNSVYKL